MIKNLQNPGVSSAFTGSIETKRSKGKNWYVVGGESGTIGANTNNGLSWNAPFATLAKAVSVASAHDTIYISAGSTSATLLEDSLTITQNGLKIIGIMTSFNTFGWPSLHTHDADPILTINAAGVEIAYLSFHHQGANVCIRLGAAAATWRTHIHDCFFGGNSTSTYGIDLGNLNDAPYTVVERCEFQHFATAGILLNAYSSTIKDCHFMVSNSTSGIVVSMNGGDRPYSKIFDNNFISEGTAAKGVDVTNTPTAGLLTISGNRFNNFSTPALACTVVGTTKTGILGAFNQYGDEELFMYPRRVSKSSATPLADGTLFNYTGTIGIVSFTGRVTKTHPAAANTCKLSIVSDALAAYDICAVKDLTGLDLGTLLSTTGTAADAMVATDAVGAIAPGQAGTVIITCTTSGTITVTYSDTGDQDSSILWEVLWIPISQGAKLW
jgi:hypothetical protein